MSPTSTSDAPPPDERAANGAPAVPAPPPPVPSPDVPPPPPPPPAPSLARSAFVDVVTAVGALLFANVALGAVVVVVHLVGRMLAGEAATTGAALTAGMMPQLIVAAVFATLLAALLTWWLRARRMAPLPAMRSALAYPLAIGAGLLIQAICIGITTLSARWGHPLAPTNADPMEQLGQQAPWAMWGIAVLVAPAAEELLFRHVLVRRFALAGRAALGIVLTSLLFAALHEPVPGDAGIAAWLSTVALYMAMGAGFGMVYVRTGRLGAAFAAHAACNLAALSAAAFSTL